VWSIEVVELDVVESIWPSAAIRLSLGDVDVGIQLLDVDDVVKSIWLLEYIQLLLSDVGKGVQLLLGKGNELVQDSGLAATKAPMLVKNEAVFRRDIVDLRKYVASRHELPIYDHLTRDFYERYIHLLLN
jgi:hypothetical protein